MHAKKMDKLATGVLYSIATVIVIILTALILFILVERLPHVNWHFFDKQSHLPIKLEEGWNSVIQLIFPLNHYAVDFCASINWSRYLFS